jgi:hypothetical protein
MAHRLHTRAHAYPQTGRQAAHLASLTLAPVRTCVRVCACMWDSDSLVFTSRAAAIVTTPKDFSSTPTHYTLLCVHSQFFLLSSLFLSFCVVRCRRVLPSLCRSAPLLVIGIPGPARVLRRVPRCCRCSFPCVRACVRRDAAAGARSLVPSVHTCAPRQRRAPPHARALTHALPIASPVCCCCCCYCFPPHTHSSLEKEYERTNTSSFNCDELTTTGLYSARRVARD